jgi:hypothetical protein
MTVRMLLKKQDVVILTCSMENTNQYYYSHIHFHDLYLAVIFLGDFLKDRCNIFAGAAPLCPEIDQHRLVRFEHVGFKGTVGNVFYVIAHDVLSEREVLYALICEVVAGSACWLPALRSLPGYFFVTQLAIILACCVRPMGDELNLCVDLEQRMLRREFRES